MASKQPKARPARRQPETVNLAAAQRECEHAARLVAGLFAPGAQVPDYITDAVMVALYEAARRHDIDPHPGKTFDLPALAYLLASSRADRIKVEPAPDLAELISRVLNHLDVPRKIYEGLSEGVAEYSYDADSAEFVRFILAGAAKEKGGDDGE